MLTIEKIDKLLSAQGIEYYTMLIKVKKGQPQRVEINDLVFKEDEEIDKFLNN